ncbi:MAG TPA: hypothetical protein VG148_09970 [Pyrinomonadaceae bacterium]|nr:hypothetical protein [Pyrinomonadaceae bacterium]
MKIININRDATGTVTFDEVSIDTTENVCFANLDPQEAHWPDIASNQVGPYKSANSSECVIQAPSPLPGKFSYQCKLHAGESGVINVFAQLAVGKDAQVNKVAGQMANATQGAPIPVSQVVQGGKPPYTINRQLFQVTDGSGNVIQSGSGVGPGLQLNNNATTPDDTTGITVSGTPSLSGTYTFALDVDDSMGRNLQQQYTMVVA